MPMNDSAKVALRGGVTPDPEAGRVQPLEVSRDVAAKPATPAPSSALLQAGLLAFFVMSRSVHPILLEKSKVGKSYPYEKISVPLAECILTLVVAQAICLLNGGAKEWLEIWRPKPMLVFSVIGGIYAFGDYLELNAMGSLSGPAYQVLSQSKLIVTAGMLWGIKGQKQNSLQWVLLTLLMLSLCCYMIMKDLLETHRDLVAKGGAAIDDGNGTVIENVVEAAATTEGGSDLMYGVLMVVLKVIVSCLCAVLSDKYMKDFKSEPIYMQLVQFKVAWLLTLLALTAGGDAWEKGLFHSWNAATCVALGSFTVKGWSTMYLLAILDSMLKNIGEACTVLVTYFIVVMHPGFDDQYENETFITVMVVFLSVVAYLAAKTVVAKAEKYDTEQLVNASRA